MKPSGVDRAFSILILSQMTHVSLAQTFNQRRSPDRAVRAAFRASVTGAFPGKQASLL
jgi:hypothetical protein